MIAAGVKQRAEAALNSNFSDVPIHANSAKAQAGGAMAYTQGMDIDIVHDLQAE